MEQVWCDFLGEESEVSKVFSYFKSSEQIKSLPSSIDIGIVKSVTIAVSSVDSSSMKS